MVLVSPVPKNVLKGALDPQTAASEQIHFATGVRRMRLVTLAYQALIWTMTLVVATKDSSSFLRPVSAVYVCQGVLRVHLLILVRLATHHTIWMNRFVRSVAWNATGATRSAKMRVRPASLGENYSWGGVSSIDLMVKTV